MTSARDMTPLQLEILQILLMGMESTLLLVEFMQPVANSGEPDPFETPTESELHEALRTLETHGLVRSRVDQIPSPQPDGGIPEYSLGRTEVVWWDLTPNGRLLATAAADDLGER